MENIITKSIRNISTNMLLSFLFLLILEDYFLTYLGIHHLRVIEEANPLMVGLMALPLSHGIIIKIISALIPIFLLKYVEHRLNPIKYRKILLIPIAVQIIPYTAHVIWIYKYFSST